jgi:hypothetical protein
MLRHELREEICQLRTHSLKRKLLQGALFGFGDNRGARIGILQHVEPEGSYFTDRAPFATSFWERDSFNRAISAYTNGPAEKRVPCDLARHATPIQLQNNLMPGDF